MNKSFVKLAVLMAGLLSKVPAEAAMVRVEIQSLAPSNGTFQTPFWVGFHDGSFDLYDQGAPASMALERIAEDGSVGPIMSDFSATAPTGTQGVITGPGGPLGPGETGSMFFSVDPMNRYFSYASMVIPSNDAFIANGNPMALEIFDGSGAFLGADFVVLGSHILDAGTEVNDEVPAHTAFFGQMTPNTGVDENGVVHTHPGFLTAGSGGILDDPMFADADFAALGYEAVRIRISAVPDAGSTLGLMVFSSAALGIINVRKRRH